MKFIVVFSCDASVVIDTVMIDADIFGVVQNVLLRVIYTILQSFDTLTNRISSNQHVSSLANLQSISLFSEKGSINIESIDSFSISGCIGIGRGRLLI